MCQSLRILFLSLTHMIHAHDSRTRLTHMSLCVSIYSMCQYLLSLVSTLSLSYLPNKRSLTHNSLCVSVCYLSAHIETSHISRHTSHEPARVCQSHPSLSRTRLTHIPPCVSVSPYSLLCLSRTPLTHTSLCPCVSVAPLAHPSHSLIRVYLSRCLSQPSLSHTTSLPHMSLCV